MNLQSIIRSSVLACAVTVLCAAPSWAVPVNITAITTSFGTTIHTNGSSGSGTIIYKPLVGTLMGHLESLIGGGYQLTGLMGELRDDSNPNIGVLTVLDGTITDDGVSGSPYAHGTITYNLTGSFGPDVIGGVFTFLMSENANKLTATSLKVWGGDLSAKAKAVAVDGLGFDFIGDITPKPVPEPSTMILLGSGLVGLVGWRYRKSQA